MKKVLFTTTALVASASFAAADVSVSGYAEMGLVGGSVLDLNTTGSTFGETSDIDLQFHQDVEVTFSMSGETDGGLTFGASVQLDEGGTTGAGTNTRDDQGYAVNISGSFGTLTLGDTDGAFDKALTETGMLTSIADDHTTHAGYNGNSGGDGSGDGQVLRYDYSFGDFAVAVSAEQGDNGAGVVDDIFGIGASFGTDMGGTAIGVGLGYQSQGDASIMGVSLSAAVSGFDVVVNYSDAEAGGENVSHIGLGLGYSMDALSIAVNYGQYDVAGVDVAGLGAAVNYDLGGGAVLMAGYGSSDIEGLDGVSTYSLGLGLSF